MRLRKQLSQFSRGAVCLPLLYVSLSLRAQGPRTPPVPPTGPGLVVTYVEASPAKIAVLTADLKAYAGQIENSPAKPKVAILGEFGRPNRVVVIEQWPDLSSPSVAEAETLLTAKVQPEVQAPIDRRVNLPMTPALPEVSFTAFPSTAFFVLMHIDIGGGAAGAPTILQAQRDAVVSAPGALGYGVTFQDHHNNHFTISEVWKSRAAYEAYTATGPAQDFRRSLATLIGAPFDDRFYARVGN
jgi:quinol monooxygenase YgiN